MFIRIIYLTKIFFKIPLSTANIGAYGELLAAKFLKNNKHMKILCNNFRSGKGEIDLVCLDKNCIVFVEVKTRNYKAKVDGYFSAMNNDKRRILRKTAYAYLYKIKKYHKNWRFDIVDIRLNSYKSQIKHFENINI